MTAQRQVKFIIMAGILIVLAVISYDVLTTPDNRNGLQRLGDAVSELPNGADKAARELKDRTPIEKIGDEVKDTGKKLNGTNQ